MYHCPWGAISDKSFICDVIKMIKGSNGGKNYKVYAVVAPSITTQFAYARPGQVIAGIKALGFADVIEAALGADMVAQAEQSRTEILMQGMDGLTAMQSRIRDMKKEIDQAQKIYADTSISMSGMFNAINDAVNITDNQLITVLGPVPETPAEEPKAEPKRTNGNEDVWRTPIL